MPETARRRCDREDDVEAEIVGLPQRAVELVRVRDRVGGTGERDQRVGQRRRPRGRPRARSTPTRRPPSASSRARSAECVGCHDLDRGVRARSATRACPGARSCRRPRARPRSTSASASSVTPPTRSTRGSAPVQSTIVDSTPTAHGPPSSTTSTSSPRSRVTAPAVVGLTRPNRLADGAAIAAAERVEQLERERMVRHPQPDRVEPAGRDPRDPRSAAGTTSVSGPGQKRAASVARGVGHGARPLVESRVGARGGRSPGWSAGRPFTAYRRRERGVRRRRRRRARRRSRSGRPTSPPRRSTRDGPADVGRCGHRRAVTSS